ncbi:MAG: DUF4886 domain-containing protein [Oscillospiraceae bacterium]|nr:DUF4886 domain-containing protein [Oscillospiraceae bacterium]
MKKTAKRLISLLLAFVLAFGAVPVETKAEEIIEDELQQALYLIPEGYPNIDFFAPGTEYTVPETVTADEAKARVLDLAEKFEGKFFTVSGNYCTASGIHATACSNCLMSNVIAAEWVEELVGMGTLDASLCPTQYSYKGTQGSADGYQCFGFANFAHWYVFAEKNTDKVTSTLELTGPMTYETMIKALPGDVIRSNYYGGHSMIFIDCDSTGYTVLDSNHTGNADGKSACIVKVHKVKYNAKYTVAVTGTTNYDRESATEYFLVKYNANGGTGAPASQIKTEDVNLVLASDIPTFEGREFLGWARTADAAVPEFAPGAEYSENADITLYAVWSECRHSYKNGICTICGGAEWDTNGNDVLEILMIGNSFSWDASDFWYDMQESMTYNAMKSMIADQYDVHLAVMYKGSATLAYHATCAMKNTASYTYTEIGPETNYKWTPSSGKNADNNILSKLDAREWDIIVIQSYQHEADGTEPRSTYTGGDARFEKPEDSVGYLLDYFAEHEPAAEVYYYMPWATTKFYGDDTVSGYKAIAEYSPDYMNMKGINSGREFAGTIPVGTGIQNARTTYFDALRYSSGTGETNLLKDPQIGLQYDVQHLSFGIGRYIAGVVVAETLIPQSARKDSCTLPVIKESPAVGELPLEYTEIAQLAAKKAISSPYEITTLNGYEKDPADRICDSLVCREYKAEGITDEAALVAYMQSILNEYLKDACDAETTIEINSFQQENGVLTGMDCSVTLRVGYTTRTVNINVTDGKSHVFGEWIHETVPSAEGVGIDKRICKNCGFVETVEVEGSWQKFALADHLQKLPDAFCSKTNLWSLLVPEKDMIDHQGNWVDAGSTVYSVTIPVSPGDRIYANSFDQTGSRKGIQVSFIGDYGIVKTTFSSQTYSEFHANGGYLIAPEGAIAVNIPVWDVNAENNVVNILDAEHIYESVVTEPTCTEQGYTTYTCKFCGESYVGDYVPALGHTYANGICTICGAWEYPMGDINLDGSVNVKDAYYARLVAAKLIRPTEQQILLGDADLDGKITALDANIIRKFAVKIITEIPVKK